MARADADVPPVALDDEARGKAGPLSDVDVAVWLTTLEEVGAAGEPAYRGDPMLRLAAERAFAAAVRRVAGI